MCGIVGIISADDTKVNLPNLKSMADAIAHRGPDGEGFWINSAGKLGFGHRRLSIIDLSENGKQPMHYANGRYSITFNGEIYNYIELRDELTKRGYLFHSATDTEVLLALFDYKKEKCLDYIDGMFAFSIWDEHTQQAFFARDRFGEKPLFYTVSNNAFYFASEIKAFWAVNIEKQVDELILNEFIHVGRALEVDKSNRSFYKNIFELKPGHYFFLNVNDLRVNQQLYYSLPERNHRRTFAGGFEDASKMFRHLLEDSIHKRLRADVSVGSSLSGGLDSSVIVSVIDNIWKGHTRFNTFSARFENFKKDEGNYIDVLLKKATNLNPHFIWLTPDIFFEDIDQVFACQDEPFGSSSIFAQYKVMQAVKDHGVKVLMDGQGSDEQLAGYLFYYNLFLNEIFHNGNSAKYSSEYSSFRTMHAENCYAKDLTGNDYSMVRLKKHLRSLIGLKKPFSGAVYSKLREDTLFGLKNLLRYADRNSMAASVEVRLPFLSHKLVDFIFSIPTNYKLHQGWTKFILRKSFEDVLPHEIAWRVDKTGFETPENIWFSSPIGESELAKARLHLKGLSIEISTLSSWNIFMLSKYLN